jgi:predicted restriction endonuclease
MRPLALKKNPYIRKDQGYFDKRAIGLTMAKFRKAIYEKYKHQCPVCGESLHNGEIVEMHHMKPRKEKGKYSLKNI